MKVYIEEIEEMSCHGVTTYSLVQGMDIYRAEVRASGIEIYERDNHENGPAMDEDDERLPVLKDALVKEIYKEK